MPGDPMKAAMPMTMHMTELEERLAGPGGAELRETLVQRLAALEERLRQQLRASLPRDEFAVCEAAAGAAQAARETLCAWPVASEAAPAPLFPSPFHRRPV